MAGGLHEISSSRYDKEDVIQMSFFVKLCPIFEVFDDF